MSESSKHKQLTESLSGAVVSSMREPLDEIKTEIASNHAETNTVLNAILARLEIVESMEKNSTPAKRAPKGERKGGKSTTSSSSDKSNKNDQKHKIKNARLYARYKYQTEEQFREKYMTPEIEEKMKNESNIQKKANGSDQKLSAEGFFLYDNCFTDQQKEEIKNEFKLFKEELKRADIAEPLDADNPSSA